MGPRVKQLYLAGHHVRNGHQIALQLVESDTPYYRTDIPIQRLRRLVDRFNRMQRHLAGGISVDKASFHRRIDEISRLCNAGCTSKYQLENHETEWWIAGALVGRSGGHIGDSGWYELVPSRASQERSATTEDAVISA